MDITVKRLCKNYGDKPVLSDFSLMLKGGKISVIMGKSGSGKTTFLNCLARLTDFSGEIDGNFKAAYVFQDDRLIRHMSVYDNLEIILSGDEKENAEKIKKILNAVNLTASAHKLPSELSGGERKRVALARAFISGADVILLDEPLNSLDFGLKRKIDGYVVAAVENEAKTAVYVTHDIDEALSVADEIIVISGGRLSYIHEFETKRQNRDLSSGECSKVRRELSDYLY